jgi:predicted  nucleic acid-binding Zn-ribbon protein
MDDPSTERAIGRLEGKLDSLLRAVDEQKAESSAGRRRIYIELEAIRVEASVSKEKIGDLEEKMAAAAPEIAHIKRWKERFIGMRMLIVFMSATFGGAVVAGWKWILMKLGY